MGEFDAQFKVFRRFVDEQMRFLADEFGFRETKAGKLYPGMWIGFSNSTTAVTVNFELAGGLWVALKRLDSDGNLTADGCALEHLLMVRAPEHAHPVALSDFDPEVLKRTLETLANLLKLYASDVLAGNFEVFPEALKVRNEDMARRQAEYLNQK